MRVQQSFSLAFTRIGLVAIILIFWEFLSKQYSSVEFAIARPNTIYVALLDLCDNRSIIQHIWATGSAAFVGMVLGTLLGTSLGLMTWFSRSVAMILRPFIVALGALPILAVAPLMIIWFGIDLKMKIALAVLSTSSFHSLNPPAEQRRFHVPMLTYSRA